MLPSHQDTKLNERTCVFIVLRLGKVPFSDRIAIKGASASPLLTEDPDTYQPITLYSTRVRCVQKLWNTVGFLFVRLVIIVLYVLYCSAGLTYHL